MLPLETWFPEPLGPPLLPLFPGSLCSRPTGLPAPWAPQAWFGLRAFTLPVPSACNALRHLCGFPSHLPWLFVHMSTRWCGQWTGAWANSGRWWRTGKPGMLQSMGSQRVGRNLATEGQQQVGEAYFKLKPTAQSRLPFPCLFCRTLITYNHCVFYVYITCFFPNTLFPARMQTPWGQGSKSVWFSDEALVLGT